ncbi:MAG: hypothetical protein OM95_06835 [Bdellovibrio sp. ArHS]|uniref:hypothetical protein n=1 Tax=Bdellovibrio sp. ArHS TaxID=1569284 RepID=UPI000583B4EA|nr:hypothetical protein [Bdellovibrio sp. ArHS]KHD88826.1 MAG: hypothetical protein OM95_06835 [Bdellovibrio sp. ArHS]
MRLINNDEKPINPKWSVTAIEKVSKSPFRTHETVCYVHHFEKECMGYETYCSVLNDWVFVSALVLGESKKNKLMELVKETQDFENACFPKQFNNDDIA